MTVAKLSRFEVIKCFVPFDTWSQNNPVCFEFQKIEEPEKSQIKEAVTGYLQKRQNRSVSAQKRSISVFK
jgi:hypothetical protein